jgi:GAF domain-containing protein
LPGCLELRAGWCGGGYCGPVAARGAPLASTEIEGQNTHDRPEAGSRARDAADPVQLHLELGRADLALAQTLIDELSRAHSLQHCALLLWDTSVGRLRLAAQHWGAGEDLGEVRAGAWTIGLNGICGRAFRLEQPVLVADVEDDPDFLSFPGSRTRSELAVPVLIAGRVLGVVNLESPRVRAYGPADIAAVQAWIESVTESIRSLYQDPG